jgi:hypothetical protein
MGAFAKQSEQLRILEEGEKERAFLAKSEQARQVGAYTVGGGPDPIVLVIVNDSGLPISSVEALAKAGHFRLLLCGHEGYNQIVHPHSVVEKPPAPAPALDVEWHTGLAFNDDSGSGGTSTGSSRFKRSHRTSACSEISRTTKRAVGDSRPSMQPDQGKTDRGQMPGLLGPTEGRRVAEERW